MSSTFSAHGGRLACSLALLLSACGGGSDGVAFVPVPAVTAAPVATDAPAAPSAPVTATAQQVCAKLADTSGGGASRLTATVVAATATVPAHCKVNGTLAPKLNFELRFPESWNGKVVYQGNGGMSGSIPPASAMPRGLQKGYVQITSDDGHQGSGTDASWALDDPQALQLWGSLSVPTVMSAALEIVRTAYGKGPSRAYFEGCSTGGRQGLMAVQRAPLLFDGVIAGDPSYSPVALGGFWNRAVKLQAAPGGALANAKVQLISRSALKACDALDGIVDGVISNPAACTKAVFDPSSMRCASGKDEGDSCLSDAQLASVNALTTRIEFGSGKTTYSHAGFSFTGNESEAAGWPTWITGGGDVTKAVATAFQDSVIKNIIARDRSVSSLTYAYDDENALFAAHAIVGATATDIRPFINDGRKLLLWHAGADPAYPAENTADYLRALSATLGKEPVDAAVRFYVPPGVLHCAGGPGADQIDFLQALDEWVSKDAAPETLSASKTGPTGQIEFTRPLCRYPQYPRYIGAANDAAAAKLASSYACTSPP